MTVKKLIILMLVIAFLAIFNAFMVWSIFVLYMDGRFSLMVVLVILTVMIDLFVLNPKGYPYRYMIPALVLLFILTLYPMYYTFEVAFTNFGTGHLFTRQEVVQRLLNDYFYVPEDPTEYDFSIFLRIRDYKPTDEFIILFERVDDGKEFFSARPLAEARDNQGNIISAAGTLHEGMQNNVEIGDRSYRIVRDPDTQRVITLVADTGEAYQYFYAPKDPDMSANAPHFISEIRGKWLRNAEFIDEAGNMLRLSPQTLYRTFATIERQYGLRTITDFSGQRPEQITVVYNRETDNNLTERDGAFFDIDDFGREFSVMGYISNVGFRQFRRLLEDPRVRGPFFSIFSWTFTWAGLSVLFSFVMGLALAITLNDRLLKGKKLYRTLLIIPWAIPSFISVLVWKNGLFNETYGILNRFLVTGLFGAEPIRWLGDAFWARVSVLMVNTWLGFPYMMTVCLGALQSIPDEFYEAASIDGASKVQQFGRITFPLLMVTIAPLLVGSFAFNFNNFVGIFLLTEGGPPIPGATTPAGSTDILISYTYKLAFYGRGQDFGFASAISIIIFAIVAGFSWLNFKVSRSFEEVSR
ncbi:MAG TPA: maltose ABC transporter permease [Kosmotogaceae bacterium]|nr:MAG: Permease component of ABC-type sugar transporter [Thermotogales bacterium 46_20]HAA84889.1 maltose ABC transporter permease [Kosmotogaceae bacterium]